AADVGDDADSIRSAADGMAHVAEIQQRLGRLPEGERAYRAALELLERLQRIAGDEAADRRRRASAWNNPRNLLRQKGQTEEAADAFARAVALGEASGALDVARTAMNQALNREMRGDAAGAEADYRAVLTSLAALENAPATSEAVLALLAQLRVNLGSALTP